MRFSSLLTLLLASASTLSARQHSAVAGNTPPQATQQAKTTAPKQRITGYSYRLLTTAVPNDTIKYIYNTVSRGSGTIGWYGGLYPDPMQSPMLISCDSFTYKLTGINQRGRINYNTDNLPVYMRIDSFGSAGYQPREYHYYEYNTAMRRVADSQYFVPSTSSIKRYRTYDGSGFPVTDSVYSFTSASPASKVVYTNNTAGDPIEANNYYWNAGTMSWELYFRTTTVYDASNRRTLSLMEQFDGTSWTNYMKDTFAYTGSFTAHIHESHYSWLAGAWVGTAANDYTLNTAGKWDTSFYYSWNSSTNSFYITEKDFFLYNTAGNIVLGQGIFYNASTGTYDAAPYDINRFYYEDYDDVVGVNERAPLKGVTIYPNPAKGKLYIDCSQQATVGNLQVTITDLQGRKLAVFSPAGVAGATVDVADYVPGTYMVTISNGQQSTTRSFIKE